MTNVLKMVILLAIQSLRSAGLSCREIARRLGVHRETVSRHLRQGPEAVLKPANAPISPAGPPALAGFEAPNGKIAVALQRSDACPWGDWLIKQRSKGLSSKRIHQDLLTEFPGARNVSYDSVRRLLKRQGASLPIPFRRMESPPGHEAQIDFGTGAPVVDPNGRRRKTHVLRVVLSHSRKAYSEAVFTQSTDDFLHCIENAFEHFGGVPRTLVVDNLKAAVLQADWFDPEINPKFADFCRHYGTVVLPTKRRTPRHKGKTERGVAYVQDNALKGRTFQNLAEQNEYLESWEDRIADRRIHGTTKRQVLAVFQDSERQTLERGVTYLLGKVRTIGPQSSAWADAVVTARGVEGHRVVQGLLSLTHKHTCTEIEAACETALSYQCYRLRTVRQLIGRRAQKQKPLEFLSEHPLIRPLDDYAAVVARAIHRRQSRPSMGEGFERHDTGIPTHAKDSRPASANSRGDIGHGKCLRSGYPSPGCSSAEPDSVSPDKTTLPPDSSA